LVTSKETHAVQAPHSKLEPDDNLLIKALQSEGTEFSVIPWGTRVDDPNAVIVLRNTWDYHKHVDEFVSWTKSCRGRLFNPPHIVSWNTDKSVYLRDLAIKGVPIVPSHLLFPGDNIRQVLLKKGWSRGAVLKPTTSVGAFDTVLIPDLYTTAKAQALFDSQAPRAFLVQPFMSSIQTEGEVSMVYISGGFSHAVKKIPAPGDYRAHFLYNAKVTKFTPSDAHFQVVGRLFQVVDHVTKLLYARIDLVTGDDGKPCILELELIEPMLYFAFEPTAASAFAKAVKVHLQRRTPLS